MNESLIIAIAIVCQANSPNERFVHRVETLQTQQIKCLKDELKKINEYKNIYMNKLTKSK